MSARIVFMGTPNFAVPSLTALMTAPSGKGRWQVVAVVTQPDRPRGRGRTLTPSPVKVTAEEAGIPVLQPETVKTEEAVADLASFEPDLIVVAAFGQILRKNVLDMPPYGCVNVHASLLPRWRGAAPVAAAIRAGDKKTGITLMLMDEGLDTGPLIAQRALPIKSKHTRGTLTAELAHLGAELVADTLPAWLAGEIKAQPQEDRWATLAPQLRKEEGAIDWRQPADVIARQVRAFLPWPGTFTNGPRGRLKVLEVEVAADTADSKQRLPGTVFEHERHIYAATGQGSLRLVTVQPAGKKQMPAEAMVHGQPELLEAQLGEG